MEKDIPAGKGEGIVEERENLTWRCCVKAGSHSARATQKIAIWKQGRYAMVVMISGKHELPGLDGQIEPIGGLDERFIDPADLV